MMGELIKIANLFLAAIATQKVSIKRNLQRSERRVKR